MNYTLTPNLNRAHKIEAVKAHLDQYADHYMLATCALALAFLAGMFIGEWREGVANDARLESVHKDGVAVGYQLAINTNAPTVEGCMAFWFNGDTKRVGKAIKQIKLEKS